MNINEGVVSLPKQSSVRAYVGVGQTINYTTSSAEDTIVFNVESFDIKGEYNNGTGIFTCRVAGKYLVVAGLRLDDLASGLLTQSHLQLRENANTMVDTSIWSDIGSASIYSGHLASLLDLAVGDTVKIVLQHKGSGSGSCSVSGSDKYTHLCIQKVC